MTSQVETRPHLSRPGGRSGTWGCGEGLEGQAFSDWIAFVKIGTTLLSRVSQPSSATMNEKVLAQHRTSV